MLMKARDLIQISMVNNNRPTSKKSFDGTFVYQVQGVQIRGDTGSGQDLENRIQSAYSVVLTCHHCETADYVLKAASKASLRCQEVFK